MENDAPYTEYFLSTYFLFTFFGNLLRKQDISKLKQLQQKNQLLRWSWEKQKWQQLYEEALALEVKLLCHIPSIGLLSGTGGL